MNRQSLRYLLIVVIATFALSLAAGCGGDDENNEVCDSADNRTECSRCCNEEDFIDYKWEDDACICTEYIAD